MGRILFFLLLLALAWTVWRVVRQRLAPPSAKTPEFEPMARCARCGVHVPAAALDAAGRCGRCAGLPPAA